MKNEQTHLCPSIHKDNLFYCLIYLLINYFLKLTISLRNNDISVTLLTGLKIDNI